MKEVILIKIGEIVLKGLCLDIQIREFIILNIENLTKYKNKIKKERYSE